MRIGFNVSIDPEVINRVRRARDSLNGMLDNITDDPRHKAAKDRFELDARRRVNIIGEASKYTLNAAVRADRRKGAERHIKP